MNRLDQFLNAAARQMSIMPTAARADELRELRGHLEQRAEDYRDAGTSDDAAQLRALEGLGSPRKLGASLCDAWEGFPFDWWRVLAAILGVTAVLLFGIAAFLIMMVFASIKSEVALLPEITPSICAFYVALPLLCGVLFSHWLGRRGCIVAMLYFVALALGNLTLTFPQQSEIFIAAMAGFTNVANAPWFPYFWVALAWIGAWGEQSWRLRKRHQLALRGGRVLSPSRFLWVPLNLDWWRNAVLATLACGAIYGVRVWIQFHPQTPTATFHKYLVLNREMNSHEFEPPQILELRELPAISPAEIAGTQKRVWFKIEQRMTPSYQSRRVAFLKRLIQQRSEPWENKTLRQTLNRMQRNHQITQGVAILFKTSNSWKINEKTAPSLGDWAYDLYYKG